MNRAHARQARLARRKAAAGPAPHLRRALGGAPLVDDWTQPKDNPGERGRLLRYLTEVSPALHAEGAALQAEADALVALGDDAPAVRWEAWRDAKAEWKARLDMAAMRAGV